MRDFLGTADGIMSISEQIGDFIKNNPSRKPVYEAYKNNPRKELSSRDVDKLMNLFENSTVYSSKQINNVFDNVLKLSDFDGDNFIKSVANVFDLERLGKEDVKSNLDAGAYLIKNSPLTAFNDLHKVFNFPSNINFQETYKELESIQLAEGEDKAREYLFNTLNNCIGGLSTIPHTKDATDKFLNAVKNSLSLANAVSGIASSTYTSALASTMSFISGTAGEMQYKGNLNLKAYKGIVSMHDESIGLYLSTLSPVEITSELKNFSKESLESVKKYYEEIRKEYIRLPPPLYPTENQIERLELQREINIYHNFETALNNQISGIKNPIEISLEKKAEKNLSKYTQQHLSESEYSTKLAQIENMSYNELKENKKRLEQNLHKMAEIDYLKTSPEPVMNALLDKFRITQYKVEDFEKKCETEEMVKATINKGKVNKTLGLFGGVYKDKFGQKYKTEEEYKIAAEEKRQKVLTDEYYKLKEESKLLEKTINNLLPPSNNFNPEIARETIKNNFDNIYKLYVRPGASDIEFDDYKYEDKLLSEYKVAISIRDSQMKMNQENQSEVKRSQDGQETKEVSSHIRMR